MQAGQVLPVLSVPRPLRMTAWPEFLAPVSLVIEQRQRLIGYP